MVGFSFRHADGTRCLPLGTTCYAWTHQGDELEETTLQTLAGAPWTKVRMCVFPKSMVYNENEPPRYPFEFTEAEVAAAGAMRTGAATTCNDPIRTSSATSSGASSS